MAVNFYLNNHLINVETNATFISNLGSQLDTGTLSIAWSQTGKAIAPMTHLKIVDTDLNETWEFVVINDNVEIVKKVPTMKYLHNLTLTQNTNELSKHILRNTRFSQPLERYTTLYDNFSCYKDVSGVVGEYYYYAPENLQYNPNIFFNSRVKFKTAILKVKSYTATFDNSYASGSGSRVGTKFDDFNNWEYNTHTSLPLYIKKIENGTTTNINLDITNETNKELDIATYFSKSGDATFGLYHKSGGIGAGYQPTFSPVLTNKKGAVSIVNIKIILESYYYSLYDILEVLLEQDRQYYNSYYKRDGLFTLPARNSEDGLVLDGIVAPELDFSGVDLYSAVAQTLSYIDAIPVIKDGVLSFEYLNSYNRTESSNINMTDKNTNLSEEYFTNKLIANYQNAKQDNAVIFPAKNLYSRANSSVYGIPSSNDYRFNLPSKIDYLDEVLVRLINKDNIITFNSYDEINNITYFWEFYCDTLPNNMLDITSVIFSQEIYATLDKIEPSTFPDTFNQLNTLYYTDNYIYLGQITKTALGVKVDTYNVALPLAYSLMCGWNPLYNDPQRTGLKTPVVIDLNNLPNKQDLQFNVSYHSVFDGRVSIESVDKKYDGETFISQTSGSVSLNRMGNQLQGLIAKLGNESKNVGLEVSSYGSRMRAGTIWVDDDGNKYIANSVKISFGTASSRTIITAQFTKNYNNLSQFTSLDQEKRFYEISNTLISKGYDNINEFIYFSKSYHATGEEVVAITNNTINTIIRDTFKDGSLAKPVDLVAITTYENLTDGVNDYSVKDIYCPIHSFGLGNMLCFEMGFESPNNAFDRLIGNGTSANPYVCKPTLYVNESAFADKITIKAYHNPQAISTYATENFPILDSTDLATNYESAFVIDNYRYYKKPNEIFHLNYALAFLPYATYTTDEWGLRHYQTEEIFFGDEFINNNAIIRGNKNEGLNKTLYVWVSDEKYSIIDNKAFGTKKATPVNVSYNYQNGKGYLLFTITGETFTGKSWCIADELDNVYIACNQTLNNANQLILYFITRRNRL